MSTARIALIAVAALALMTPAATAQQQNNPRVGYVYPAGGQQGTTFRVRIGCRFLASTNAVLVSTGA
jgi:hypothetical protein